MISKTFFTFFIASVLNFRGSFGYICYTCSSTPVNYDNDCYYGHNNVSSIDCYPNDQGCWTRAVNNFDGTFNISRYCFDDNQINVKDVPWFESRTFCTGDFCNTATYQIPSQIKCYACTSTPNNYDDDCYHGRASTPTTTCDYCWAQIRNNFDDTFNVTRGCYHYSQAKSSNITWSQVTINCGVDLCNDDTPHIDTSLPYSSTVPTSSNSSALASPNTFVGTGPIWILTGVALLSLTNFP